MSAFIRSRLDGATGIAFVGLFLASFYFGADSFSGPDQSAEAIAAELTRRVDGLRTSVALVALASVAGYWFIALLHRRLARREASAAAWAAFGGGLATVTVILGGAAIKGASVTVDSLGRDPQVAKTLWLLEHGFFDVLIGPPLVVFTSGVSIVSLQRGDPPRWVGWSGIAVTAGLVANIALGLGSLSVLGFFWVLALAVALTVRGDPE